MSVETNTWPNRFAACVTGVTTSGGGTDRSGGCATLNDESPGIREGDGQAVVRKFVSDGHDDGLDRIEPEVGQQPAKARLGAIEIAVMTDPREPTRRQSRLMGIDLPRMQV